MLSLFSSTRYVTICLVKLFKILKSFQHLSREQKPGVHSARYLLSSLDGGFSYRETILKFVVHLGFKIGKKNGVT
jgi:hypothetical protein